jgi:hypothetical protein
MGMLIRFLQNRNLKKRLEAVDWNQFAVLNFSDYENQSCESDFIFQLRRLNTGVPGLNFPGEPAWRFKENLFKFKIVRRKISITDFYGSNGGKSGNYRSLKEYSKKLLILDNEELFQNRTIKFQTDADFETNISRLENHFDDKPLKAYFFPWSNRYYLLNEDCSHTIGAIYRQCTEQRREYEVDCELHIWEIDRRELSSLQQKYFIYLATQKANELLSTIYYQTKGHDWFYSMNISHTDVCLNFIDRNDQLLGALESFVKYTNMIERPFMELDEAFKEVTGEYQNQMRSSINKY